MFKIVICDFKGSYESVKRKITDSISENLIDSDLESNIRYDMEV